MGRTDEVKEKPGPPVDLHAIDRASRICAQGRGKRPASYAWPSEMEADKAAAYRQAVGELVANALPEGAQFVLMFRREDVPDQFQYVANVGPGAYPEMLLLALTKVNPATDPDVLAWPEPATEVLRSLLDAATAADAFIGQSAEFASGDGRAGKVRTQMAVAVRRASMTLKALDAGRPGGDDR